MRIASSANATQPRSRLCNGCTTQGARAASDGRVKRGSAHCRGDKPGVRPGGRVTSLASPREVTKRRRPRRWRSATRTPRVPSAGNGKRPKLAALRQRTLLYPFPALATRRHQRGFTATATSQATATATATATVAARNVQGNCNCRCAEPVYAAAPIRKFTALTSHATSPRSGHVVMLSLHRAIPFLYVAVGQQIFRCPGMHDLSLVEDVCPI